MSFSIAIFASDSRSRLPLTLACFAIVRLALVCIGAPILVPMTPADCKRNDSSVAATLDRVCEDCYNLFREPHLHTLCKKNCFDNEYFISCIEVLLLDDEMESLIKKAVYLNGGVPILGDYSERLADEYEQQKIE